MNLKDIVNEKMKAIVELENFTNKIKDEKRKMSDEENLEFKRMSEDIENLNKQIEGVKTEDNKSVRNEINIKNKEKNMSNFSLLRTIKDIVEKRTLSEESMAVIEAGRKEFKENGFATRGEIVLPMNFRADIMAGVATQGQEIVAEEKGMLLGSLKAKTVLGQAGAKFISLVGDFSQPLYAGTTSYWASETGSTTNGAGAFSEVTFAPKRLTTQIEISKQFLVQDSINAEATIMQDLVDSILVKVEATALDATAGDATRPAGLFYGADYAGTLSGATTFVKLVGIKAAVETSNALTGSLSYITTPSLYAVAETTPIDVNGGGIMALNNGKVAGYPVYSTSNVNSGKIAFGNWNDYVVAQWGGMDLTIDPYTKAGSGKVVITANTFWDFKVIRSASFKLSQLS